MGYRDFQLYPRVGQLFRQGWGRGGMYTQGQTGVRGGDGGRRLSMMSDHWSTLQMQGTFMYTR